MKMLTKHICKRLGYLCNRENKKEGIVVETMTVKFTDRKQSYKSSHRKDNLYNSYRTIDKEFQTIVDCRTYATKSMVYCCIWIRTPYPEPERQGSGSAGGYEYDKESAAVAEAIENAGIDLSQHIGGRGDTAIEIALNAITKKVMKGKKFGLIKSYA